MTFARSPSGHRWMRLGRVVFVLGVAAWLAYKLYGIGWQAVWAARPRTPWFYVIWLGLYLQLPLVEARHPQVDVPDVDTGINRSR